MGAMVGTSALRLSHDSGYDEQGEHFIPCFRCGVCCTRLQVRLSLVEARRIADELGIAWGEFIERYTDHSWPGATSFLLRQVNGACIFLEHQEGGNKASCLIHRFKPSSCREWTPSLYRRECREGLAKYWGLMVSPSGQLQGTGERIKRFQSYVESLIMSGETDADLRV